MGVARWRWRLAPLVIVVAGCLPQPTLPPAAFLDLVQSKGSSFAVVAPPSGTMTMDEAIDHTKTIMARDTPVQAIFGTVTCPDATTCRWAFDTDPDPRIDRSNVSAFPVWVVWSTARTGPDVGVWFAVNLDTGTAPLVGGRVPPVPQMSSSAPVVACVRMNGVLREAESRHQVEDGSHPTRHATRLPATDGIAPAGGAVQRSANAFRPARSLVKRATISRPSMSSNRRPIGPPLTR